MGALDVSYAAFIGSVLMGFGASAQPALQVNNSAPAYHGLPHATPDAPDLPPGTVSPQPKLVDSPLECEFEFSNNLFSVIVVNTQAFTIPAGQIVNIALSFREQPTINEVWKLHTELAPKSKAETLAYQRSRTPQSCVAQTWYHPAAR